MAVGDRLVKLHDLGEQVRRYNNLVINSSFTEETLAELKGNAKGLCDEIKDEVASIKTDIDAWGE